VQRLKMPLNGVPKQKAKLSMQFFFIFFFRFFHCFSFGNANGNSVESVALTLRPKVWGIAIAVEGISLME